YIAWRHSAAVWDDHEAFEQLTTALTAVLGARPDAPTQSVQVIAEQSTLATGTAEHHLAQRTSS
uniref:hypothetical protein n=1 Tax=Aldersonia kunmingensis TaxID=408066 RepID=UPI000ADEA19D